MRREKKIEAIVDLIYQAGLRLKDLQIEDTYNHALERARESVRDALDHLEHLHETEDPPR